MHFGKVFGLSTVFGIQDEIDVTLTVQRHIFVAVASDGDKTK